MDIVIIAFSELEVKILFSANLIFSRKNLAGLFICGFSGEHPGPGMYGNLD
jgi:hypothetical protein